MWNSRACVAMAIAAAGLAVVAASPASACWGGGYYGAAYGGCGSYYGAAYGGYGDLGYAGTSGWTYGNNLLDWGGPYGYAGGWGGFYGAAYGCGGYGSYGYGYAPACNNAGLNSYNGFGYAGCGRTRRLRGAGYAVASYRLHRPSALAAATVRSTVAARPARSKIAYRANLKLAHAD